MLVIVYIKSLLSYQILTRESLLIGYELGFVGLKFSNLTFGIKSPLC